MKPSPLAIFQNAYGNAASPQSAPTTGQDPLSGARGTGASPAATNEGRESRLRTGLKIFQGNEQNAEHVAAALK